MHHEAGTAVDPVCGMTVDPATAAAHRSHDGVDHYFCGTGCADAFDADPARFTSHAPHKH
jgi:Cu+-exporting ATPase